jgi:hypothetical protein
MKAVHPPSWAGQASSGGRIGSIQVTPMTDHVLIRRVEAASALRAMSVGALGLLLGGVAILCVAYELGDEYRGRFLETGPQQVVAVTLAGLIAILGGFTFVRGLAAREQARPGADPVAVLLVTFVTVPLAALTIGGYAHTHPPDKHVSDPRLPYSFTYPGTWEPDPPEDLAGPQTSGYSYVVGVSKQVETSVTQGVLVRMFQHDRPGTLHAETREWLRQEAAHIVSDRSLAIDGRRAFRIDYELGRGNPHGAEIMAVQGNIVYWIACVYKEDPGFSRRACDKVVETFDIKGLAGQAG